MILRGTRDPIQYRRERQTRAINHVWTVSLGRGNRDPTYPGLPPETEQERPLTSVVAYLNWAAATLCSSVKCCVGTPPSFVGGENKLKEAVLLGRWWGWGGRVRVGWGWVGCYSLFAKCFITGTNPCLHYPFLPGRVLRMWNLMFRWYPPGREPSHTPLGKEVHCEPSKSVDSFKQRLFRN